MNRFALVMIPLAVFALATPSVAQQSVSDEQNELSTKLDSLEANKRGLSIYGEFGTKNSMATASGDLIDDESTTREIDASTRADLTLEFRSSEEFRALLDLRLHQDWNNYYDEGLNPFVLRWFNIAGNVQNGHLDFELGDFHTRHSPLTIWSPSLMNLEFEPAIFKERRQAAMKEALLLDDNSRHLQGANVHWTSGAKDPHRIEVQAVGARLRTPWANTGIIQYYNSDVEKYAGMIDLRGTLFDAVQFGVAATMTYDRIKSSRSYNYVQTNYAVMKRFFSTYGDAIVIDGEETWGRFYENNFVYSGHGTVDIAKLLKFPKMTAKISADVAVSYWDLKGDVYLPFTIEVTDGDSTVFWNLPQNSATVDADAYEIRLEEYDEIEGQFAALVQGEFGYRSPVFSTQLDAKWMKTDLKYVADMAQSSVYEPRNISASFANPVTLDLDALYNSMYVVDPITYRNSQEFPNPMEAYIYNGTNNYIRAGFIKNAFTDDVSSYMERNGRFESEVTSLPFEGILPNGYATANRTGFDLALHFNLFDNALGLTGLYTALEEQEELIKGIGTTSFGRYGVGATVHLGSLLNYAPGLDLNGGFVQSDIDLKAIHDFNNEIYSAGITLGITQNNALLAGWQRMKSEGAYSGFNVDLIQQNFSVGVQSKIQEAGRLTFSYTRVNAENAAGDDLVTLDIPALSFTMDF